MSMPGQAVNGSPHSEAEWVKVAYLRAVLAVYGPWTESKVISAEERKRARARVYEARAQLGRIERPPHGQPSPDGMVG
jgi:hypothetical protein